MRRRLALAVIGSFAALPVTAQLVVNARAGMITYAEGTASILSPSRKTHRRMLELLEGETLESKTGLAEMQLSADTMIRVAKQSQVRMIRSALEDTQLELVSGAAIVEVNRLIDSGRLRIRLGDCTVELAEIGVYRLDARPARLRVYRGEATIDSGGKSNSVKSGKMMELATHLSSAFDKKDWDPFHEWAALRSFRLFNFSNDSRRRPSQWTPRTEWTRRLPSGYWSEGYGLEVRRKGGTLDVVPRRH